MRELPNTVKWQKYPPSRHGHEIYVLQCPYSRAINVGYIKKHDLNLTFVPGRLNLGPTRASDTYMATLHSLLLPPVHSILHHFEPKILSTITILRETLSCRVGDALYEVGIRGHFGDAFIGATHIKGNGEIKTAYLYENIEGLAEGGLWIVADSICMGRNTGRTLETLLGKIKPKELIVLGPIASRIGIEEIGSKIVPYQIPTTFVAWGALFGVDENTKYDMPWGHPDTEPLDKRDQELMVSTYGEKICMGGDFGNDYFCPSLALKLYDEQLKQHSVTPKIPDVLAVMSRYGKNEILVR